MMNVATGSPWKPSRHAISSQEGHLVVHVPSPSGGFPVREGKAELLQHTHSFVCVAAYSFFFPAIGAMVAPKTKNQKAS